MGFIYFYSLGQRHQKGLVTLLKNVIKQLFSFSLTTIFHITQIDTAYSLYCMYTVQYTRGGRFSQIKNRHMASVSFGISKSKKTNKLIYLSHTVPNMIWICAYTSCQCWSRCNIMNMSRLFARYIKTKSGHKYTRIQGCGSGSGSAWIRIHFSSWNRIQEGSFFKNAWKLVKMVIFKFSLVNLHKLHCF